MNFILVIPIKIILPLYKTNQLRLCRLEIFLLNRDPLVYYIALSHDTGLGASKLPEITKRNNQQLYTRIETPLSKRDLYLCTEVNNSVNSGVNLPPMAYIRQIHIQGMVY